ncbi:MAG: AAA family ATPase [Candidatus Aminicenantes bacterium]
MKESRKAKHHSAAAKKEARTAGDKSIREPNSGPNRIELNPEFRLALDLIEKTGRNVFITGKAGTGKSTLLEYFRQNTKKQVAVLAPTGVAALNVRGQTIHSFFGFRPDITLDKIKKVSPEKRALYKNLDMVIIDEISMVRADLLDCVEKHLRMNGPFPKRLFGGVQMVFIGDLYQLPPVVTAAERPIFSGRYSTPYFFSANLFSRLDFDMDMVELEKVYRQTDSEFIQLLNAIRNRSVTDEDILLLNQKLNPHFIPPRKQFYIYLTSTNQQAWKINQERLHSLKTPFFRYRGMIDGKFDVSALPTDEVLEIKVDSQIMMVNNDRKGRWVNGTVGRVVSVPGEHEDGPILVERQEGGTVSVQPYVWELFRYEYDERSKKIYTEPVGAFYQYPLRLAWAITIHKSQGKTFDRVVIDIGRGTFAHGQVYVALSRCTGFDGLVLKKEIHKKHIRMDYRVVRFLTRFQYKKADSKLSYAKKTEMIRSAIDQGRSLETVYLKPNDTKTRRRILPRSVQKMEFKGREFEGVKAFCFKRGEERVFRIDRMLELKEIPDEK